MIVIFWPEFCVFKDIQTRQTISCGIKRGKLHYLDLQSKDSNKLRQTLIADGSESEEKKSKIWLWHQHLGHLPPGCMVSKKQCQKVCKLKKSLYGLKQSSRAWFGRFTKSMRAFGYR